MLYLDATELLENPGMSLRRVANFAGVPPLINENNFFFDEEKGSHFIWMTLYDWWRYTMTSYNNVIDYVIMFKIKATSVWHLQWNLVASHSASDRQRVERNLICQSNWKKNCEGFINLLLTIWLKNILDKNMKAGIGKIFTVKMMSHILWFIFDNISVNIKTNIYIYLKI